MTEKSILEECEGFKQQKNNIHALLMFWFQNIRICFLYVIFAYGTSHVTKEWTQTEGNSASSILRSKCEVKLSAVNCPAAPGPSLPLNIMRIEDFRHFRKLILCTHNRKGLKLWLRWEWGDNFWGFLTNMYIYSYITFTNVGRYMKWPENLE